jgi:hypothetical protein
MADLSQTAANVGFNDADVKYRLVQFGEAVTQGMPVYRKAADGKYWKAQNDNAAADAEAVGICIVRGAAADAWGLIATEGNINIGATLAVGESYFVSNAFGAICPAADVGSTEFPTFLGIANSATNLELKPSSAGVAKA